MYNVTRRQKTETADMVSKGSLTAFKLQQSIERELHALLA